MKKYIKFILALGAVFGAGFHLIELTTPCVFFLIVLQLDLEKEVKELIGANTLLKMEKKYAWSEYEKLKAWVDNNGTAEEDINGIGSVLVEYDPKQIESATDRLIAQGLVDNKEQALLNLEMDLEERKLLALGSEYGKNKRFP